MANVSTATTNFNQTVVALVNKRLEELLRAPLPHLLPGNFRQASFVKGTNNTMRFISVPDLSVTAGTIDMSTPTAPWLKEGVAPTAEGLTIGYEEFSAGQAGRVVQLTDVAMLQSPFDLLSVAADRIARNAIATADKYVSEILSAGTRVDYAGGAASRATIPSNSSLTGAQVKLTVARMKSESIPTFSDGTYRAIVHPGSTYDLESDTSVGGWVDAQRYAGSAALFSGEVGRYAGVRFIESPNAAKFSAVAGPALPQLTAATTDIVTAASAHGLVAGNRIKVGTVATGVGLTSDTTYYVIAPVTDTTFKLSTTLNGSAVDITTAYTGTNIASATVVNDVLSATIFGPEAYAFGDWGTIQTYFTAPGGTTDPLHQLSQIGWKGYFGAVIMGAGANTTNMPTPRYRRIEHTDNLLNT